MQPFFGTDLQVNMQQRQLEAKRKAQEQQQQRQKCLQQQMIPQIINRMAITSMLM
jgi:hypothetical protein